MTAEQYEEIRRLKARMAELEQMAEAHRKFGGTLRTALGRPPAETDDGPARPPTDMNAILRAHRGVPIEDTEGSE